MSEQLKIINNQIEAKIRNAMQLLQQEKEKVMMLNATIQGLQQAQDFIQKQIEINDRPN